MAPGLLTMPRGTPGFPAIQIAITIRIGMSHPALALANATIIVTVEQIAAFLHDLSLGVAEHTIVVGIRTGITYLTMTDVAVVIPVQTVKIFPVPLVIRGLVGRSDRPGPEGACQEHTQRECNISVSSFHIRLHSLRF